ncbi:MAG: acyltransferase [Bacteroidetes bacterium]|uniref:Acyltransferase n=1 Tax=Candidatus Cryptobacteroides excrementipullorum TaxID=2840761 RepID=A0A9D9IU87_9BACT|nr:acyltransferase [Candidatus Cryptobacteroides excrementipullorum]
MINYVLTLIAPVLSLFWGGYGSSKRDDADDLFSKDYTTVLKGICCIFVVMVHIPAVYQNRLQDAIGSFAFVCVTLFFMVSSYGMQLSAEHKKNYIRHFWRNRLLALLVPCILINIVVCILFWLIRGYPSFSVLWSINNYVVVLLEYCFWFYVVMLLKRWFKIRKYWITDILLIAGIVLSSLYSYLSSETGTESAAMGWCYERYGLVWGILMYRYLPYIKRWLISKRCLKVIAFSLLCCILGIAYLKFKTVYFYGEYLLKVCLGLVIILWMLLLTVNRKFGNKVSLYLGNISYEVYLLHGSVMTAISILAPDVSSGVFILSTYFVTVLLSMVISAAARKIVSRFRI